MPLYAGVCETSITPPFGASLCGYAPREPGIAGVHDELFARAVVLDNGAVRLCIVALDLIGLDDDLVAAIRAGASLHAGLEPDAVLLNCSHTHAGPCTRTFFGMPARDEPYVDVLVRKVVGAIRQAGDEMRPASLAYGRAPVQIGVNRRLTLSTGATVLAPNCAGPVASHVDALTARDSRGRPFAVLFAYPCQGTTLGSENRHVSADFPGRACAAVRAGIGAGVTPLFLQGCAGDINPLERGSFEAVERSGALLGDAVIEAVQGARAIDSAELDFATTTVCLPLAPPPPVEQAEAAVAARRAELAEAERTGGSAGRRLVAEGMLAYAEQALAWARTERTEWTVDAALQRLTLGRAQLLAMPVEPFVRYGLDLAQQAPGPTFALGYSNGLLGYLPTAAEHARGGYEVDDAHRYYGGLPFAPECERLVRAAAYDLLGVQEPHLGPYGV